MGIESLGNYYLNETRFSGSLSAPGLNREAPESPPPGEGSFAALLDRARAEASPARQSARAGGKPRVDKGDKLYEQCQALETFLVKTLITGMRKTVQKSEFLDGGFAGEMYEDMLYDEYAKDFSKNANFGLAELAYLELTGQRGKLMADHA
jgi:flagellar protein FlgJ